MKREILALIRKDLIIEWRQRYAINGMLLHVAGSVFVVFLSVKMLNPHAWNAVFWLIMLFTSVSAVARSFTSEPRGRLIYYYTIASPQAMILSRIILNCLLMLVLSVVCLGLYSLVMGNPVEHNGLYLLCVLAGCIGFSGTFTMLSGIASKSGNGNLLMPVLSFPVVLPLLLVLIKACKKAMDGLDTSLIWSDLLVLMALNAIVVLLAYLLFPYLWRD
jgi:heme exporter protein B